MYYSLTTFLFLATASVASARGINCTGSDFSGKATIEVQIPGSMKAQIQNFSIGLNVSLKVHRADWNDKTLYYVDKKTHGKKFQLFINDDLDTPKALALSWELVKDESVSPEDKRATLLDFDKVFGLKLREVKKDTTKIPENVRKLAEEREQARKDKAWDKADALRLEIESLGYEVKDEANGFVIRSI